MTGALLILTIALPWFGAAAVALAGDSRPNIQHTLAVIAAAAAAAAAMGLWPLIGSGVVIELDAGAGFGHYTLVADGLGVLLACIAAVIGCLTVVFSVDYMHAEAQLGRYYAFVLIFIGAMCGLVLTGSLFVMFLFWEVTALCSYVLISFNNDDPRAVAGGMKALIMTQLGGIGLLAGAVLAYSRLGTFEIRALLAGAARLDAPLLAVIGFSFVAAAAAKSAQFPFHTWLPDAMEAPTPVSALIHAATMVNAGIYLLARFYPIFAGVPGWTATVMAIGLLSMLIGALQALAAEDLKRLLAFSTISQLGYLVYSVGAGAILASQFHLLSHAIFKALLFLSAGAIIHALGTRDLNSMGGLSSKMPLVRNAFLVGAAALGGLPPLNGFFSKEFLLDNASGQSPAWAYWLALTGAGLTACYITRAVDRVFFFHNPARQQRHVTPSGMSFALGLLAVMAFASTLLVEPISRALQGSLPYHQIAPVSAVDLAASLANSASTYAALGVSIIGASAWLGRSRLKGLLRAWQWMARIQAGGFHFESINRIVSVAVHGTSAQMARVQTGLLNWNLAWLVGGLCLLLLVMTLGGLR